MTRDLILTPRDHDFFIDLYDLVFLDVEYLKKVHFKGKNTNSIYRRTKRLVEGGYITTFRLPITDRMNPSGRAKNVFTLDTKGLEEVREILGDVKWDTRWTDRTPSHIYHCLEMAQMYAAFRNSGNEIFEIHDWLNESRSQYRFNDGRDGQIKPDGTLILKSRSGSYAGVMIEMERSKQRKEVSVGKLKRYNQYCKLECFREQDSIDVTLNAPPRIIFISARENEMRNLILHTKEVDTDDTAGVLYTTMDKIKKDPFGRIFYAKDSKDPEQLYGLTEDVIFEDSEE